MSRQEIKLTVEVEKPGTMVVCDQCGLGEKYDPWNVSDGLSERWMMIYRHSRTWQAGPQLDFCSWVCLTQFVLNHQGNPFEGTVNDDG